MAGLGGVVADLGDGLDGELGGDVVDLGDGLEGEVADLGGGLDGDASNLGSGKDVRWQNLAEIRTTRWRILTGTWTARWKPGKASCTVRWETGMAGYMARMNMGTVLLDLEGNVQKFWTRNGGNADTERGDWIYARTCLKLCAGGARRQSLNENLGGRGPKNLVRGRRYCWPVDARYELFKQIGGLRNYLLNDHTIYEIWLYTYVMAPP